MMAALSVLCCYLSSLTDIRADHAGKLLYTLHKTPQYHIITTLARGIPALCFQAELCKGQHFTLETSGNECIMPQYVFKCTFNNKGLPLPEARFCLLRNLV